jgi:hypothetical protein
MDHLCVNHVRTIVSLVLLLMCVYHVAWIDIWIRLRASHVPHQYPIVLPVLMMLLCSVWIVQLDTIWILMHVWHVVVIV